MCNHSVYALVDALTLAWCPLCYWHFLRRIRTLSLWHITMRPFIVQSLIKCRLHKCEQVVNTFVISTKRIYYCNIKVVLNHVISTLNGIRFARPTIILLDVALSDFNVSGSDVYVFEIAQWGYCGEWPSLRRRWFYQELFQRTLHICDNLVKDPPFLRGSIVSWSLRSVQDTVSRLNSAPLLHAGFLFSVYN